MRVNVTKELQQTFHLTLDKDDLLTSLNHWLAVHYCKPVHVPKDATIKMNEPYEDNFLSLTWTEKTDES